MSSEEPMEAYVYQPLPAHMGDKIYQIAGPGSGPYRSIYYTRKEACEIVREINYKMRIPKNE